MEGPPETLHIRISITRHPLMMPDDALPSAGAAIRYHPRPAFRGTAGPPRRDVVMGRRFRVLRFRGMALFKRGKSGPPGAKSDLSVILLEGRDMIEQVGEAHGERWGLGTADSWAVDQAAGIVRWTFADKTAEAPVQILGSFNESAGSWLWAWANESVLPDLRTDSERVRAWADANGHTNLAQPKIGADAESAATMAAIAFRVSGATGFYRGPGATITTFMTFGPVTITTSEGESETFTINVSH